MLAAYSVVVAPARAADVSGAPDAASPLVVSPTQDPLEASYVELSLNPRVAYVQRMPATRIVERIVIGDFRRGQDCSTDATGVKLTISRSTTGRLVDAQWVVASTNLVVADDTPAAVELQLPTDRFS
jgi:hypothetical protein